MSETARGAERRLEMIEWRLPMLLVSVHNVYPGLDIAVEDQCQRHALNWA